MGTRARCGEAKAEPAGTDAITPDAVAAAMRSGRVGADQLHRAALDALRAAHHLRGLIDLGRVGGPHLPHRPGVDSDGLEPASALCGSTATNPTPMFRVRSRSACGTAPKAPIVEKTGGGVQVLRRTLACTPGGSTRARLAAKPPPVTCESA